MMADPNRNPDGTFKEGCIANPEGINGPRNKGFTTWDTRVTQLEDKYPTLRSLLTLFVKDPATGQMTPGEELMDMNDRDVAIIMQRLAGVMGDDKRGERESFWDRKEGKPVQRNEFSGPNGGAIEYADAAAAREKLLSGGPVQKTAADGESPEAAATDRPAGDSPPA